MSDHVLFILGNRRYLETTFTKKLIASSERNLNNTSEFSQLFRSVDLDICNALEEPVDLVKVDIDEKSYLEIGCQLLDDSFPSYETFYENICWFEILKLDVFLDERLIPGH